MSSIGGAAAVPSTESLKMANATTRPMPPPPSTFPRSHQGHHQDTLTRSPHFPLPHIPISLSDIQAKARMSTSSLSLLLPSAISSSSPTQPLRAPQTTPYQPSPLAAQLEQRSQFLVEAINANNFTSQVTDHIAPGFRAAIGDFNNAQDFHAHAAAHQHVKRSQGLKYRVRVVNASADVDERAGCATVFQLLDVQGYAESMRTQAICVLKWSKAEEEGRWLLEALYGMSGLGNSDG